MTSKQVEDVYNAHRAAGKIDIRVSPIVNKYQCEHCNGTGEAPEATSADFGILASLQKQLDDLSVPSDQHDAMAAAAYEIEKLRATIKRHRQDRQYVDGFSDGFDAAIARMKPDIVNLKGDNK